MVMFEIVAIRNVYNRYEFPSSFTSQLAQNFVFGEFLMTLQFPVFNTSPIDETRETERMEVDEGDLTLDCDSLSIRSPKNFNNAPVSGSAVIPHTNISLQPPHGPFASPILSVRPSPLWKRVSRGFLRSIGDLDDQTMRRIAMFPYVMSGYIQLLFNITLPAFFLYWLYSFSCSIQSDVEKKVQLFSEEVMEQIGKCSRDYRENRCDPSTRVPALIAACQAWEECMARDPHLVARRSGISAEIFGTTLNSFFDVLSWKSIASLVLLIAGVMLVLNTTFSWGRKPSSENPALQSAPKSNHHNQLTLATPTVSTTSRRRKF